MAGWSEVESQAPELAVAAREFFDAFTHKTIATLRRDGSPRISGTEMRFAEGDLWLGMMRRSVKALDLLRDPRLALHSGSVDPPEWNGDAKIAGSLEEIVDEKRFVAVYGTDAPSGHLFRAEITELVVVRLGEPADHLVIESWHEGRGVSRKERR